VSLPPAGPAPQNNFVREFTERLERKEESPYARLPMDTYTFLRDGVRDGALSPEEAELWNAAFVLRQQTGRPVEELKEAAEA
jgi:hypothetical protein